MFKRILYLFAMSASLSSCQIYKTNFECIPGEGVPCASVSEIEGMIIETPSGPDLFVGKTEDEYQCKTPRKSSSKERERKSRLVWIAESRNSYGEVCETHYIQLPCPQEGCQ